MPYHQAIFANGEYYHVYNRGVEKRVTYLNARDYHRFLQTLAYYRYKNPPSKFSYKDRQYLIKKAKDNSLLVEIICFCLMPNHFHLLIRQIEEGGVSKFMSKTLNSYTKYFNTKQNGRVGPLFQGAFKAVRIESDEQLLHVSRYIHLNPVVDYLVKDLKDYQYSSYVDYLNGNDVLCKAGEILGFFKDTKQYERFVLDHEDYARRIKLIERAALDD